MVGVLRVVLVVAVLCGSIAMSSGVALAGREWCDDDPIFTVGDGAFRAHAWWAQGAGATGVTYVLEVPSNVTARAVVPATPSLAVSVSVTPTLPLWNGHGEMPAVLHTTVSGAHAAWAQVAVVGSAWGTATGATNQTLTVSLSVYAGPLPSIGHSGV